MPNLPPPAISLLSHGATIQTLPVPLSLSSTSSSSSPSQSHPLNIVQSFPTASLYTTHNTPYFGETIGRVANRISDATISSLNGRSYALGANNGGHCLHGGEEGWGKREWRGPEVVGRRRVVGLEEMGVEEMGVEGEGEGEGKEGDEGGEGGKGGKGGKWNDIKGGESVKFTLRSEHGDEGFPGTLDVSVIYTAGTQRMRGGDQEAVVLAMEYEAELVDGLDGEDEVEETVVNMTNHSYFNLTGDDTIKGTEITLATTQHLPVSATGIPTSTTPVPFPSLTPNEPFTLGATSPAIDHCFILPPSPTSSSSSPPTVPIDTRSLPLKLLVTAYHPTTRIHLEVFSTEPAFQFYTGEYIDVPAVKSVPARGPRSGFCVEPSRYVNAINEKAWRGQVLLRRGERYGARIVYRAWCDGE